MLIVGYVILSSSIRDLFLNLFLSGKSSSGGFTTKKQVKKQVSYGRREDYIINYEQRLMSRYRIGYSDLVKMLIVKAAQSEFHDLRTPFR